MDNLSLFFLYSRNFCKKAYCDIINLLKRSLVVTLVRFFGLMFLSHKSV